MFSWLSAWSQAASLRAHAEIMEQRTKAEMWRYWRARGALDVIPDPNGGRNLVPIWQGKTRVPKVVGNHRRR